MSEMVERVARAICEEHCQRTDFGQKPCVKDDGTCDRCRAPLNQLWTFPAWDQATRAITAMREATAEMINAVPMEPTAERVRYYREMIDAALK